MFRIRALLRSKSGPIRRQQMPSERTATASSDHLIEKSIPPEWLKQFDEDSSTRSTPQKKSSVFVPGSVSGWVKTMDRDAGDDEKDFARVGVSNFVPDTKLTKYVMNSTGVFYTVKTASPERIIDILHDMKVSVDVDVLTEIVSRIEYLSTTLSVKTIRLLLGALSEVPGVSDGIPSEQIKAMVRALGNEILCRFHALSLYSCACILSSLSKLRCVEPGTLNILGIAFEKLSEDPNTINHLSDQRILEHSLTIIRAFKDLGYSLQVATDTGVKMFNDRQNIARFVDMVDFIKLVGWKSAECLVPTVERRIGESSCDELLRLVAACTVDTPGSVQDAIRTNFLSRMRRRGERVALFDREDEDEDGLPVGIFRELTAAQLRTVRDNLKLDTPELDDIVSSVS